MKNVLRTTLLAFLLILVTNSTDKADTLPVKKKLTFEDVQPFILFFESSNGRYKFNRNKNGTVDCGEHHINSRHFLISKTKPTKMQFAIDSVFNKFKIPSKLKIRVMEAMRNDTLNEELAIVIFRIQGVKAWMSYPKFKQYLEGYKY